MPFPLIAGLQEGAGLVQALIGGGKAKKAQKQLENLQSPTYAANKGILDYYNSALSRYGVSGADTAMYKRQQQDINRGVSTGIASLQDRRSGLGGVSSILRAANDASLNANVAAEQQRDRRFAELGGATQLKAGEEAKEFEYNKMMPFQQKYNLLSMKAGAANQTANAGLSNIFGGLQNASNINMMSKMYGTNTATSKKKKSSGATTAGYGADFDNYEQPM